EPSNSLAVRGERPEAVPGGCCSASAIWLTAAVLHREPRLAAIPCIVTAGPIALSVAAIRTGRWAIARTVARTRAVGRRGRPRSRISKIEVDLLCRCHAGCTHHGRGREREQHFPHWSPLCC